jgi:DNA-binding protein H-NS
MATLEQIQARMKKLQAQAEALLARKAQAAVDQIRDIMLKHGLTTADIEGKAKARGQGKRVVTNVKAKAGASAKGVLPPKYRDPKTGATWSGHARPPQWIKDVKDRAKFLIAGASASVAANDTGKTRAATKSAGKAVIQGKLPPKYRDPKTGATWSGHARPPQWIAGAKDRTKFLIAGATEAGATDAAAASKAKGEGRSGVVVKKAAARKAVVKKAPAAKKAAGKRATPATKKPAARKAATKKPTVAANSTAVTDQASS